MSASRPAPADFNGDGYDDLAVGVPGEDVGSILDAGAVQVFYGTPDGAGSFNQIWHLNSAGIQLGAAANDRLGSSLATGDFNLDGYADLAVGAPLRNGTRGQVLVLYGSAGGLQAAGRQLWDQGLLADAPENDDRFGSSLVSGDFDSDGYYDLAIGVPGEDFPDIGPPGAETPWCGVCKNAGVVNLVYGTAAGLSDVRNELWHQDRGIGYDGWVGWQDCFGSSLSVGDFDGDRADDLAVGAACELTGVEGDPEVNSGALSVYYGMAGTGLTGDRAAFLFQWSPSAVGFPQMDDAFGYAVAAGDYNGDGYDDLAIGVPGEEADVTGGPEAGALMVYYGAADSGINPDDASTNEIWSRASAGLPASASGGRWGWSVAAGDFNRDGIDDVAVGSPMDDVNGVVDAGSVTMLFGTPERIKGTGNALVHQDRAGMGDVVEPGDWFGQALYSGDFNGDTVRDLGVGVPFENVDGVKDAGALAIVYGGTGVGSGTVADQLIVQGGGGAGDSAEPGDQFGGRSEPRLYGNPWETTPPVDGDAGGGNAATLSGRSALAPAAVNLTADGTTDWIHWGPVNGTEVYRKAGVDPWISTYTALGGLTPFAAASASALYAWTDGTPRTSAPGVRRGTRISPMAGGGFRFTVPADGTLRTLKVYVGVNHARGKFTAALSDDSAAPYVTFIDLPSSRASSVVTLDYRASSPGETLTVEFTIDAIYGGAYQWIMLEAASLHDPESIPTAATPIITPSGGRYFDRVEVSLSSATRDASIYYTIDGSAPTLSSILYAGPFSLTGSATVRAVAVLAGANDSAIASAAFTVEPKPTVATPTIAPSEGSYPGSIEVTLATVTNGASIYYTTDGSTPSEASTLYTGPFTLPQSATVNAIAMKSDSVDSAVASAAFSLPGNAPAVLSPIGARTIVEGRPMLVDISAKDPYSTTPVRFEMTNTLPGSPMLLRDFGDGTGELAWQSSVGDAEGGPYAVTVTAIDADGAQASETFLVVVADASAGIKQDPDYPFYWNYGNRTAVLIGGSNHDSIFQWETSALTAHLDTLAAAGGNYLRNAQNNRSWDAARRAYRFDQYEQPFKEIRDGVFDLDQWNEVYWRRIRTLLNETHRRGIVVQMELWDSLALLDTAGWPLSAWNPDNNVNYSYADTQLVRKPSPYYARNFFEAVPSVADDAVLFYYQRRFIDKLLSITRDYNHVLYQIDNESHLPPEVTAYWANYVKASAPDPVYVADSRRYRRPSYTSTNFQDITHPENYEPINNPQTYSYLDISQNGGNSGQTHYDNLVWYRSQVAQIKPRPINHTKTYRYNWPTGTEFRDRVEASESEAGAKFWRNLFGGAASVRFHRYNLNDFPIPGLGLTALAQRHLASASLFLASVPVQDMAPDNGLLVDRESDEAYLLARPGSRYAVYFTGLGDRSVRLTAGSGNFSVRWLDVLDGSWRAEEAVISDGVVDLVAPDAEQWVAVLTAAPVPTPSETTPTADTNDIGERPRDYLD